MADNSQPGPEDPPDLLSWGMLFAIMLVFGSTFLFNKLALAEMTPMTVASSRLIIAAVPLILLAYAWGQPMPMTKSFWMWSIAYGATSYIIPFYLFIAADFLRVVLGLDPVFTISGHVTHSRIRATFVTINPFRIFTAGHF